VAGPEDFPALFKDYLADESKRAPLDALLAGLTFNQLLECVPPFFEKAGEVGERDARVQHVFVGLTTPLIEKNVYFALRLEILFASAGKAWRTYFEALKPAPQKKLSGRIAARKRDLPWYVRKFIAQFGEYMKGKVTQQKVQKDFSALKKFEWRRDCLRAYMEVSQGYEKTSPLIFYGLSFETLNIGDAHFAAIYDADIKRPRTIWRQRFNDLEPYQQERLNGLIKEKLTIKTTYVKKDKHPEKHDDPTTVEVPLGKYDPGTLPTSKADEVDEQAAVVTTAAQHEFFAVIRAGNDARVHEFLRKSDFRKLRECAFGFVEASKRKAFDDRAVTYFAALLATAVAKSGKTEYAYYAAKVKLLVNSPETLWATLYKRFPPHLQQELAKEINLLIYAARLIDDLKLAYFIKHHKDPDTRALRELEVPVTPEQADPVAKALSDCEVMINVKNVDGFSKACASLMTALRAVSDPLVMATLIKRFRARRGIDPPYSNLLYLGGVGVLYLRLLTTRPHVYKNGFTTEEHELFITEEARRDRYFGDIVLQLEDVMRRRLGEDRLSQIIQGLGALHIQAERMRMQVTPMRESAAVVGLVETLWKKKPEAFQSLKMTVLRRSGAETTLGVPTDLGNVYVYWYDAAHDTAYVQVNGYEKTLFSVRAYHRVGQMADDKYYHDVYQATAHLLVLIPLLFEVLGYIPDLVTGGVTGLIKSVAFDFAFERMVQATGIDSTTAQLLVLGAGLLHGAATTKKHADVEVEADPSAFQQAARDRQPAKVDPETPTTRGVDVPLTNRGGPDIRLTEKEPVLHRAIEGDVTPTGTRIRGDDEVPAITDPGENLSAAFNHLEDLETKVPAARRDLDQTEKSLGDVEAELETVTHPGRRKQLETQQKNLQTREIHQQRTLERLEAEEKATRSTIAALGGDTQAKNRYPDFEDTNPALRTVVDDKVQRLGEQVGLELDPKYALESPWIGRIRNQEGTKLSSGTSQGWLRNDYRFWKKWKQKFPREYSLLGPDHTVTKEFADEMRWPASTVGQKLEHHHIDNQQFVYPLPANLHEARNASIHATVTYPK